MKKILLLGAIAPFCDLVNEITALGFEPLICDYYTDAPAKKMGYPSFDVSTTDINSLSNLLKKYKVDGIVHAFSDRNILPALTLCQTFRLNFFYNREIIECLTDKKTMKAFFVEHNIPVVKYGIYEINCLRKNLNKYKFPVVLKPLDAYGSKGVYICKNMDEVSSAAENVMKYSLKYNNKLIVEEFYDADEISISAWVSEGQVYISCIYDVYRNFEDKFVLSGVSFPSKYTKDYLNEFKKLFNKIVKKIGIVEGPVTLQCFVGANGIKISELLCRLAGGSPYLYATYMGGPDLAKMVVQHAAGETIDYQNMSEFAPLSSDEKIFYDIQILVKAVGQIHYSINVEFIKNKVPEIVDLRIYYPDRSEIIDCGEGIFFARVICRVNQNENYTNLVKRLAEEIKVYDSKGREVQFIRVPQKMDIRSIYQIDWSFLNK